jgi:hypothetical protein
MVASTVVSSLSLQSFSMVMLAIVLHEIFAAELASTLNSSAISAMSTGAVEFVAGNKNYFPVCSDILEGYETVKYYTYLLKSKEFTSSFGRLGTTLFVTPDSLMLSYGAHLVRAVRLPTTQCSRYTRTFCPPQSNTQQLQSKRHFFQLFVDHCDNGDNVAPTVETTSSTDTKIFACTEIPQDFGIKTMEYY